MTSVNQWWPCWMRLGPTSATSPRARRRGSDAARPVARAPPPGRRRTRRARRTTARARREARPAERRHDDPQLLPGDRPRPADRSLDDGRQERGPPCRDEERRLDAQSCSEQARIPSGGMSRLCGGNPGHDTIRISRSIIGWRLAWSWSVTARSSASLRWRARGRTTRQSRSGMPMRRSRPSGCDERQSGRGTPPGAAANAGPARHGRPAVRGWIRHGAADVLEQRAWTAEACRARWECWARGRAGAARARVAVPLHSVAQFRRASGVPSCLFRHIRARCRQACPESFAVRWSRPRGPATRNR